MAENYLQNWKNATADLDWAKQRVLLDTLNLVADGQVKVVYGADEFEGSPCLINAVGCMVKSEDESPSTNEPALVGAFDQVNGWLYSKGVNTDRKFMSPLAAEILVRNFAPLKDTPECAAKNCTAEAVYREPKDSEIQAAMDEAFSKPPVEHEADAVVDSFLPHRD